MQTAIAGAENAPLARLFSAKHEFPTEWYSFLHPAADEDIVQKLLLALTLERFPFQFRGKTIEFNAVSLFLKLKDGFEYDDEHPLGFDLKREAGGEFLAKQFTIAGSLVKDLPQAKQLFEGQRESLGKWSIEANREEINIPPGLRKTNQAGTDEFVTINNTNLYRLNPDVIEDIIIVCHYSVSGQNQ
jgi:hypothetical protein